MEPCSDDSIADRLPFNKGLLLLRIRATPFACAFSFPKTKLKPSLVFFLPAPVHLNSLTPGMSRSYLTISFVTCAVLSVSNIVRMFQVAGRIIDVGPRKLLLEPIASHDGFPLGAVILPSSGAWLGISVESCGLQFVIAVSVT